MKRLYAAIAALLVLASASTIQAQVGGGYYWIELVDSNEVSVNTGDWNAVCKVKTDPNTIWVVGDSGKVRKYTVVKDTLDAYTLNHNTSFTLGSKYTLCDVCFPSHQYGYIVGYTDTCYTVETSGPSVPGKGYIWYNHDAVTNPTNWQLVDTMNMPPAFQQRPIPCLSVDFYNEERGYVGCGCGYVLRSIDYGESWRALRDTMLPTKPPWDSVAWAIGSIPRDMDIDLRYYNHFGDWLTEWVSFIRIK